MGTIIRINEVWWWRRHEDENDDGLLVRSTPGIFIKTSWHTLSSSSDSFGGYHFISTRGE